MLNEKQQELFSKVLDLNHEFTNENKNYTRKMELLHLLSKAKDELRKDMGEQNYNRFMNMGAKLFAPKED